MNKTTTDALCRSMGYPEGADHSFKGGISNIDGKAVDVTGYKTGKLNPSGKYSYGVTTEKMMDAPYCPEMEAPEKNILGNVGPNPKVQVIK